MSYENWCASWRPPRCAARRTPSRAHPVVVCRHGSSLICGREMRTGHRAARSRPVLTMRRAAHDAVWTSRSGRLRLVVRTPVPVRIGTQVRSCFSRRPTLKIDGGWIMPRTRNGTTRGEIMSVAARLAAPPTPDGAATPVEFAQRLRALMDAGGCSLDRVARSSRDAGTPISRATVHNLVTGQGRPSAGQRPGVPARVRATPARADPLARRVRPGLPGQINPRLAVMKMGVVPACGHHPLSDHCIQGHAARTPDSSIGIMLNTLSDNAGSSTRSRSPAGIGVGR
jgi:hypothetical protein